VLICGSPCSNIGLMVTLFSILNVVLSYSYVIFIIFEYSSVIPFVNNEISIGSIFSGLFIFVLNIFLIGNGVCTKYRLLLVIYSSILFFYVISVIVNVESFLSI